jgi:magnesium-transporting ATPase (P-type)
MIPIVSHSDNGIIYLETSSLDGEKNLKLKNSLKETQLLYNESASLSKMMNGHVDCIAPNGRLYEFDGKIAFTGLKPINQLTAKNLLPRGSKLKNVEWVIGLVVYTGVDTKVMMNGSKGDTKTSKI